MAKVKELSVGATFTKNLGNYQSLKVEANVTVHLETGDDPDTIYAEAWERVQEQVRKGLANKADTK